MSAIKGVDCTTGPRRPLLGATICINSLNQPFLNKFIFRIAFPAKRWRLHFTTIPCELNTANSFFCEIRPCTNTIVYSRFEVFRNFLCVLMSVFRVFVRYELPVTISFGAVDYHRSSLIGYLNCGHSKGPLRPALKINHLGNGLTPRLSMTAEVASLISLSRVVRKPINANPR